MLLEGLEGTLAGKVYLVEYDEEAWLTTPAETQQYCVDTWIKKAKPLGARFLVLRLVPDALFPLRGNDAPYIHERYPIEQAPERGFVAVANVQFEVTGEYGPIMRAGISRELEKYPKGTFFAIHDGKNQIEAGRVK